jgi:hypothetical protein
MFNPNLNSSSKEFTMARLPEEVLYVDKQYTPSPKIEKKEPVIPFEALGLTPDGQVIDGYSDSYIVQRATQLKRAFDCFN